MINFKTKEIEQLHNELGVTIEDMRECIKPRGKAEAEAVLDALRKRVKKNYRRIALENHPDRTGGKRSQHFSDLTNIYASIMKLRVGQTRRPQRVVHRRPPPVVHVWSNAGTSSSWDTTTSTNFGTGGRFVKVEFF